jgi:hypothetical protein
LSPEDKDDARGSSLGGDDEAVQAGGGDGTLPKAAGLDLVLRA